MLIKLLPFLACLLYGCLVAWGAQASAFQKGDTLLRARVVAVLPDTSGTVVPIGGTPYISPAVIPGVDLSYYLTDNIAVEATIGIIPHRAKVKKSAIGDVDSGRIYTLAPTVMLQYHKEVSDGIVPYLGMGMAYIKYFGYDSVDEIQYDDDFAALVQAGIDIEITEKWYANIDVKHAWAGTEAKVARGAVNASVEFNPTIYGVGMGYKF